MSLKLSQKEREQIGRDAVASAHAMIDARKDWLDTVLQGRQMYQGDGPYMKSYYPSTELFHFPVAEEKVDSFYPRVSEAFWGTDPVVRARPITGGEASPEAQDLEDFGTWAVHYDIPDFYVQWECWNRNAITDGVSTIKTLWVEDWQRTLEVHRVQKDFPPGITSGGLQIQEPLDPADVNSQGPQPKTIEDIFDEVFGTPNINEVEDLGDNKYKLSIRENGRTFDDVRVEITDSARDDQWDVRVRRLILKHASPVSSTCEPEDLLVEYRATDPQTTDLTIHQTWYTYPQIKLKRAREGWDITDAEMRYLEHGPGVAQEELGNNTEAKEQKDEFAGENPMWGQSYQNGKFLVLECYLKADLEDDGYCSEMIDHVIARLGRCVKRQYLEEAVPHGHRPFSTLYYRPNSDRYYCTGMMAQLMAVNMQINTTFNQINENQAYTNRPYFFYVPTALQTDLDVMENIKPGQGIPVNDAQGIVFPQWPQTPLADMQLFTSVMMMGDRLSGLSPLMGGSTQMKNAPRTARGTYALISEGNIRIEGFIKRAQKTGWRELLFQIFSLYGHYVDGEKWFWVVKSPKVERRVTSARLRQPFEYYFEGNTVNTNSEVMRTIAERRYQLFAAEPRYMQDLAARDELIKAVLKAYPENIDIDRAMPKAPGGGGTHQPMSQDMENDLMFQHIWTEPLQTDNHLEHLSKIQALINSNAFGSWSEASIGMLSAHYNQHAQMLLQQQAPAQLQAPPGGGMEGMANNVSGQEMAMGEVGVQ